MRFNFFALAAVALAAVKVQAVAVPTAVPAAGASAAEVIAILQDATAAGKKLAKTTVPKMKTEDGGQLLDTAATVFTEPLATTYNSKDQTKICNQALRDAVVTLYDIMQRFSNDNYDMGEDNVMAAKEAAGLYQLAVHKVNEAAPECTV